MSDLIDRQAAIDVINVGAELLRRVLDDTDVVGAERAKYEWGLGLIESYISDMKELPSVQSETYKEKLKEIADALSEKFAYMNTCLNERDIILGYLGVKRPSKIHCNTDCTNIKCESHRCNKRLSTAQPETNCSEFPNNSDIIYRQAAIVAIDKRFDDVPMELTTEILQLRRDLREMPSAQPEIHFDEWCVDCKEYDHDKHCCPRFNKVIRRTVKELREGDADD